MTPDSKLKALNELRERVSGANDKMLLSLALSGLPLMPGPVTRPTLVLPITDYERMCALIPKEEESK